jgi:sulfate transport system permease protein
MNVSLKKQTILPGFFPSLGITLLYLSLVVLIPLTTIFMKTASLSFGRFVEIVTAPRVVASFALSFGASLAAAVTNVFIGVLIAWVLVRYKFPGKGLVDALVDLPFALPTAVGGIALTTLYAENGWIGRLLAPLGIQAVFNPLGIVIALIFIGFPFVVRTVQPVLLELDVEIEEAAASLGAGRVQTFVRVVFPSILPAVLTGFVLSFARALGEYGSVVFISGNMPFKTEIVPFMIMTKLEQFDIPAATAIAFVMLVASFILLLLINFLQWKSGKNLVSG